MAQIEWDDTKAEKNIKKHGVTFEEAATVLADPLAITFLDEIYRGEERDITIELSALGKILLVVHMERSGSVIRIISARKATKKERKIYEEGI